MKRIEISKAMIGITAMQVCAEPDVTDKEILTYSNANNPCGTEKGWCNVIRKVTKAWPENCMPTACKEHKNRVHFLVTC